MLPHKTGETPNVYLATWNEVLRIAQEFEELYGNSMVFKGYVNIGFAYKLILRYHFIIA
jgi:hypothetical protein